MIGLCGCGSLDEEVGGFVVFACQSEVHQSKPHLRLQEEVDTDTRRRSVNETYQERRPHEEDSKREATTVFRFFDACLQFQLDQKEKESQTLLLQALSLQSYHESIFFSLIKNRSFEG